MMPASVSIKDIGELNLMYLEVQKKLNQVDYIKNSLYANGIFHFSDNEDYKKAVDEYEDLYDKYENEKFYLTMVQNGCVI